MGFRAGGGPLGVIAAVALVLTFAFALSWLWTTLGLILRTPNAVMSIGFVIVFPLTFMSNIFVRPDTMPSWLRGFAEANPITHLATAERGLMQGTATGGEILSVLAAAAVLTAVFAPLTVRLYRSKG
jgi:ABC-2 type transport system permease protein